jgi:hypothetical protein
MRIREWLLMENCGIGWLYRVELRRSAWRQGTAKCRHSLTAEITKMNGSSKVYSRRSQNTL